jgi:hypothetical protein
VTAPKYAQAAAIVRAQVADGTLKPGQPAPSAAHMARLTGFSPLTCSRGLRDLLTEGTLVPGPSRSARPRVAAPGKRGNGDAGAALSRALAALRRAAGLTQPGLAALAGCSVTTVGHAETGRLWQARAFWEKANLVLAADGELTRRHDVYRAGVADPVLAPSPPAAPRPQAVTWVTCTGTTGPAASSTHPPPPRKAAVTRVPRPTDRRTREHDGQPRCGRAGHHASLRAGTGPCRGRDSAGCAGLFPARLPGDGRHAWNGPYLSALGRPLPAARARLVPPSVSHAPHPGNARDRGERSSPGSPGTWNAGPAQPVRHGAVPERMPASRRAGRF